jgi:hypothetical protein
MIRQSPDFVLVSHAYWFPSKRELALPQPRTELLGCYINDTFRQRLAWETAGGVNRKQLPVDHFY